MSIPDKHPLTEEIVVAKIGGSILADAAHLQQLLMDAKAVACRGIFLAIVHGGGPAIDERLVDAGVGCKKVNGLRVTDAATLAIVVEVLNEINEFIRQSLLNLGLESVAYTAPANPIFLAEKLSKDGNGSGTGDTDLGFVGKIIDTDKQILIETFGKGAVPVIAPLAVDSCGTVYNINADQAALAVAKALSAGKLINITDVPGVLLNPADQQSLIKKLHQEQAMRLVSLGSIQGGMLPKLQSCVDALQAGVASVQVVGGSEEHCLWKAVTESGEIGSLILP